MLASITPLGERSRGRSWARTVIAFLLGAVAGGGALGAAAGALALAAAAWAALPRWGAVAAGAVVLLLLEAAGRLPSWRRQVDVRWLAEYRGWVVGLGYGAQLGAAVVTVVPTAATWVLLLVGIGSGDPAVALSLCLLFALARAAPIVTTRRVTSPDALRGLHRRLASLAVPAELVSRGSTWAAAIGVVAAMATGAVS